MQPFSPPSFEVVADTVFICTNAYTDALWPGLARTVVPVRGYTAVSRPVEEMRPLPCHALAPFVAAACIKYYEAADRWSVWRHGRRHS